MTKPRTAAKDFFLHLAAIATLYFGVFNFLTLVFQIVDYRFPDVLTYSDPYSSGIRFATASLLVILPVHYLLVWLLQRDLKKESVKRELSIRKWLIYLTLFLAGGGIVADLIALINAFLNGEITTRFVLKVLSVLAVASFIFLYYLLDLRRAEGLTYRMNRTFAAVAAFVVIVVIVYGFTVMGSPATQRKLRLDDERVNDLQTIQWQIVNYWQQKGKLPTKLTDLEDPISGFKVPLDPVTSALFTYQVTGNLKFKLCATFDLPSSQVGQDKLTRPIPMGVDRSSNNWTHDAGEICFDRTIDPELYKIKN